MAYGFGAVNKTINPSIKNKNDDAINRLQGSSIFTGRVIDVILDGPDPKAIGSIIYTTVESSPGDVSTVQPSSQVFTATPLFTNVKNYPLINEIVLLIRQPNINIKKNTGSKNTYYLNVLGIWNHPHHNAIPYAQGQNQPTQNKTLAQTILGSPKSTNDQLSNITFGKTFVERDNINPLLPFEGDVIYEGRWGNSIRFGSTVKNRPNDWSSTDTDGDPIIIIRNGQGVDPKNASLHITEDINTDLGSVYFSSTQKLPLEAASTSYVSYKNNPPILPSEYTENQIIITSGCLVFNSSIDHILLSSNKSINLNGVESVNIDSPTVTIQSGKMYLGSKNATQPLLLGNSTISTLNSLIDNLSEFLLICSTLTSTAPGTLISPLNLAANQLSIKLKLIQGNLEKLKSKSNFTI